LRFSQAHLPHPDLVEVKIRNLHPTFLRRGALAAFLTAAGYSPGAFLVCEERLSVARLLGPQHLSQSQMRETTTSSLMTLTSTPLRIRLLLTTACA